MKKKILLRIALFSPLFPSLNHDLNMKIPYKLCELARVFHNNFSFFNKMIYFRATNRYENIHRIKLLLRG